MAPRLPANRTGQTAWEWSACVKTTDRPGVPGETHPIRNDIQGTGNAGRSSPAPWLSHFLQASLSPHPSRRGLKPGPKPEPRSASSGPRRCPHSSGLFTIAAKSGWSLMSKANDEHYALSSSNEFRWGPLARVSCGWKGGFPAWPGRRVASSRELRRARPRLCSNASCRRTATDFPLRRPPPIQ